MTELVRCKGRFGPRGPVAVCIFCSLRTYAPASKGTKWIEPAAIYGEAAGLGYVWHCPNRRVDLDAIPLED